jgi:aspartyl-tRNA(Asn)/glutamyl-tRNA(Gln) amidotransferase subunit C
MAITDTDVLHLGRLANLAVDEAEARRMADELAAIVGYVAQLAGVDTTGVPPLTQVAATGDGVRADVPGDACTRDQALANAPHRTAEAFLVPRVVER